MQDRFEISYVTTLPKLANAPKISIFGNSNKTYRIKSYEIINGDMVLLYDNICKVNESITFNIKQSYTEWVIDILDIDNNSLILRDYFNLKNKNVFIKMDAWALGDSIAWIPYVEEFRIKHDCNIICSTFHNHLFVSSYPNILFVKPNTIIENVYAQYYIGASSDDNLKYSPINVNKNPLQMVASKILGLEDKEIRPDLTIKYLHIPSRINGKYVTLSEYGSSENKHWMAENGWQIVVDYLNSIGYRVLVISKEKTNLVNIIDLSGDIPISERIIDIMHSEFHLGVSSGLSWLAWSLGKHVVMISDVTPNWHEFETNITRINSNKLDEVNYLSDNQSKPEYVIEKLKELTV